MGFTQYNRAGPRGGDAPARGKKRLPKVLLQELAAAQSREEELSRACAKYGVNAYQLHELRTKFRRRGRSLGLKDDDLDNFVQLAEKHHFQQ